MSKSGGAGEQRRKRGMMRYISLSPYMDIHIEADAHLIPPQLP